MAIIGSGGIGFDMAIFLASPPGSPRIDEFLDRWGVDVAHETPGGVGKPSPGVPRRSVVMLQRSTARPGSSLGLTTGWALRAELRSLGVKNLVGVAYRKIDDHGLHVAVDGEDRLVEADSIVVCAGQEEEWGLYERLREMGVSATVIGGAEESRRAGRAEGDPAGNGNRARALTRRELGNSEADPSFRRRSRFETPARRCAPR